MDQRLAGHYSVKGARAVMKVVLQCTAQQLRGTGHAWWPSPMRWSGCRAKRVKEKEIEGGYTNINEGV